MRTARGNSPRFFRFGHYRPDGGQGLFEGGISVPGLAGEIHHFDNKGLCGRIGFRATFLAAQEGRRQEKAGGEKRRAPTACERHRQIPFAHQTFMEAYPRKPSPNPPEPMVVPSGGSF
jgi:hypothetical protein